MHGLRDDFARFATLGCGNSVPGDASWIWQVSWFQPKRQKMSRCEHPRSKGWHSSLQAHVTGHALFTSLIAHGLSLPRPALELGSPEAGLHTAFQAHKQLQHAAATLIRQVAESFDLCSKHLFEATSPFVATSAACAWMQRERLILPHCLSFVLLASESVAR